MIKVLFSVFHVRDPPLKWQLNSNCS